MGNIIRTVTLFTVILVVCTTSACLQDMDGPQATDPFTQEGEEQIQQEQAQAERERTQPQQKKQSKTGSGGKQKGQQKPAPPKVDKEKMERAKVTAFQVDGVREAFAIAIDDKVSVAVDVAQLRRFQLHAIRKEIFDRLQKAYPEDTIYVTTDRKIVWEMQKLEEQAFQNNSDTVKMQKTQQKLNDDMKG
jgi:hypothetical protein